LDGLKCPDPPITSQEITEDSMRATFRSFLLLLIPLCFFGPCTQLSAQTFSSVYSFNCSTDGCDNQQPISLTQGRDGNLYGQSLSQGPNGDGTVWKITPSGTFSPVWDFVYSNTTNAVGGVTLALDGNFYGTDGFGGTNGVGYVFKLTPAGVLTILYSFDNSTDGGYDASPLTLGLDGNLYGSDWYNCYIFKITVTTGKFSIVKTNTCPPTSNAGFVLGSSGLFYGATTGGGANGYGEIFSMTTAAKITTLHSFSPTDGNGINPYGIPVQASDGNFYGTTLATSSSGGNGVIYQMTPSGTYKVLHTLASNGSEGCNMYAGLLSASDGNLYGTANNCGPNGDGTLFQITRTGTFTVIHAFDTTDGNNPWVPPAQLTNGTLYSVVNGGTTSGSGGVYKLTSASFAPFIIVQNYSAHSGQSINILGSALKGATAVNFGSIPATSFKVSSANYMTAVVPPTAITSVVSVTTPSGTFSARGNLKVVPTVSSFTPTSGPVGTIVIITGTGFTGATRVTFGGVSATQFTVDSATQISATVPTGAKTGVIAVTTPGGSGSKGTFTVD
jgi:uncharacterized repeat protein (TIGR03803 family)